MSQAYSISTGRIYGLQRVCRVWSVARSTVYEQRRRARDGHVAARRGPQGPCSDEELVEHIRTVLVESPFYGEGYRKVWAKLRFKGIRTSKERTRRLMREHGLQAPQRVGHRHGSKAHDGTITTTGPDEIWGTDMTTTVTTREGKAAVFVAMDPCPLFEISHSCGAKRLRWNWVWILSLGGNTVKQGGKTYHYLRLYKITEFATWWAFVACGRMAAINQV